MASLSPAQLLTPEAVILDLPTAGVGSRLVCRALDVLVTLVPLLALVFVTSAVGGGTVALVVVLFGIFGFLLGYPVLMEGLWGGRTVGKLVFGLRVVRTDGGPIGLRHAAVRGGLGLLEVWGTSGSVAILSIFISRRNQRLGDMAAGTMVLRERRGGYLQPMYIAPPPGWEQLVRTMDVGGMTGRDYELVRTYLSRWGEFDYWRRQQVAEKLAGPLWQRFRHPLPPGLGPVEYLACLGAAYQLRHPIGGARTPPAWGPPAAGGRSGAVDAGTNAAAGAGPPGWATPAGEVDGPGGWSPPS